VSGRCREGGFTLVEALVAGIIMVVLGALVFTVFAMHHGQLRESSVMAKMQRQYENVTVGIGQAVRAASRALKPGEAFTDPFDPDLFATDSLAKRFLVYDAAGTRMGGFSVLGDTLEEWQAGAWRPFEAGGGPVLIDPAASSFVLPKHRNEVQLTVVIRAVEHDSTYRLPPRRDGFACRN
jgi:type II secretory pathway pseudopilin PulG